MYTAPFLSYPSQLTSLKLIKLKSTRTVCTEKERETERERENEREIFFQNELSLEAESSFFVDVTNELTGRQRDMIKNIRRRRSRPLPQSSTNTPSNLRGRSSLSSWPTHCLHKLNLTCQIQQRKRGGLSPSSSGGRRPDYLTQRDRAGIGQPTQRGI